VHLKAIVPTAHFLHVYAKTAKWLFTLLMRQTGTVYTSPVTFFLIKSVICFKHLWRNKLHVSLAFQPCMCNKLITSTPFPPRKFQRGSQWSKIKQISKIIFRWSNQPISNFSLRFNNHINTVFKELGSMYDKILKFKGQKKTS